MKFVLETHSEYLIRKLQTLVAKEGVSSDDITIYYLSSPDPQHRAENEPQIKRIKIKENGGLTAKFGTGFFDAAITLSTELFK
jgi:predicted ATPase